MRGLVSLTRLSLVVAGAVLLWGCKSDGRRDTVIASVANPSRSLRATIIQRQYFVEGREDNSPTTYVLLDQDAGKPEYEGGQDFKPSQIVIEPSQCGPLSVTWVQDRALKITCEKCGLALSALGSHPRAMGVEGGSVRIDYEGFPDMSSWESGARGN